MTKSTLIPANNYRKWVRKYYFQLLEQEARGERVLLSPETLENFLTRLQSLVEDPSEEDTVLMKSCA